MAALSALILSVPTLLNGTPFVYFDSATYLAQGQEAVSVTFPAFSAAAGPLPNGLVAPEAVSDAQARDLDDLPVIVSGRSIYYGVLAYLFMVLTGGWGLVALQALAVALTVCLAARAGAPTIWRSVAVGVCVLLAFASPAGIFVGLIMPDVWAAVSILSAGILIAVKDIERHWRGALYALTAVGAVVHTSHLLLVFGLASVAGLLAIATPFANRPRPPFGRIGPVVGLAACVFVGLSASALFSQVVERRFDSAPIMRPHLTARLLEDPATLSAVRTLCDHGAGFAVCAFEDRFPIDWNTFLFDDDPSVGVFEPASSAVKRRLSAEDRRLLVATVKQDASGVVTLLMADSARQFGDFPAAGVPLLFEHDKQHFEAFSDVVRQRAASARSASRLDLLRRLDAVHRLAFWSSIAACAFVLAYAGVTKTGLRRENAVLVGIIVIGLVGNAVICGALASPYGRFQARVAWLAIVALPLAITAVGPVALPSFSRKNVTS